MMGVSLSDQELIERFQADDLEAFHELHAQYDWRLRAFVRSRYRGEDGEDIVQATWLRAWNKHETYSNDNFGAWLFQIARNLLIDLYRKQDSRKGNQPLEFDPVEQIRESNDDRIQAMRECMKSVTEPFAEILKLKIDGLKDMEIGEQLGISNGTVASRASRGRDELKACIEQKLK